MSGGKADPDGGGRDSGSATGTELESLRNRVKVESPYSVLEIGFQNLWLILLYKCRWCFSVVNFGEQELEAENTKLLSQISSCQCQQVKIFSSLI